MKDATQSTHSRRGAIKAIAAGLALPPLLSMPARADWPSDKVIRLIIPFAAGGATDLLGRALAVEVGKSLRQSVIVENRAGAGGNGAMAKPGGLPSPKISPRYSGLSRRRMR